MVGPLCVLLALVSAAPSRPPGRAGTRPARPAAHTTRTKATPHRPSPAAKAPSLAAARAELRDVRRDPAKRRHRDRWERAIRGLEAAARGKDAAPALLDAARARYALYRYSQVDADRTAALRLAERARRAGAKEAAAFAAAVRREAGEEERPAPRAAVAAARKQTQTPTATSTSTPTATSTSTQTATQTATPTPTPTATPNPPPPPGPRGPDHFDEAPSTDPVLDRILAQLHAEDGAPAPTGAPAAPPPPEPPARDPALEKIIEQLRAPPPRRAAIAEEGARGPIRRVVVDAGHGGHDTGAIGPTGVREKDVALAIARRLATRLRAAGLEVVLTRDDDRFLALDERTALANREHGDLFVSVHANAHPRRDRGGVETYVLDVTHDRYAKRLAARENGVLDEEAEVPRDALPEVLEVRRILTDLDAKASAAPSRRLAEAVQRELASGIRARFGDVRDLGVKSALFYVLLGARMPAVLVETSFISNRVEERRLASARFQEEVAAGIARAVREFAAREARVAAR